MPVRKGEILQEDQKEMRSPKLPPNPEKGIKTILHQFRDKPARDHFLADREFSPRVSFESLMIPVQDMQA